MHHDTVFIFSGGPGAPRDVPEIPHGAPVIAADKGIDHALAAGVEIDIAVGDMDSVSAAGLAAAGSGGARIVRHPPDKDATDLELALDEAVGLEPRRIVVIGGIEGRLDHLFAELLLFGAEKYARFEVDALLGGASAYVIRGERALTGEHDVLLVGGTGAHGIRGERVLNGREGALISLFALHGPAEGVVTSGLVYPLNGETLMPGLTRGVSNVFAAAVARIELQTGVLLALCPASERNDR